LLALVVIETTFEELGGATRLVLIKMILQISALRTVRVQGSNLRQSSADSRPARVSILETPRTAFYPMTSFFD
jgi:hypothetical protein